MTTNLELVFRDVCGDVLQGKAIYNHRPDWLKNEKTGKNLELDIFYPELKLAIEANGIFHKLYSQKLRDSLKKSLCVKNGIKLISAKDPIELMHKLKKLTGKKVSKISKTKIYCYQPNKSVFGQKYAALKRKDTYIEKLDNALKLQEAEKVRSLRLMLAKGLILQKEYDEKMSKLSLSDYFK